MYILQRASIISNQQSIEDIFPERESQALIFHDFLELIKETQEKLSMRQGTKEPWEVEESVWMNNDKENIVENLKILGFTEYIDPKFFNYDVFCILGASKDCLKDRIEYAYKLITSKNIEVKKIVILGAERYVTEGVDGTKEELQKISDHFKLSDWQKLTETHLALYLYNISELKKLNIPAHIIDTKKDPYLPRPTTYTTLVTFLEWLRNNNSLKTILFISNQPHTAAQREIITLAIQNKEFNSLVYEVVGDKIKNDTQIKTLLEAFAAYLWNKLPNFALTMDTYLVDEEEKQILYNLYSKNPFIFQSFPKFLIKKTLY